MKIVVIGGTGLIGSKLVNRLRGDRQEVIPASPSTGIDAVTGAGLARAFASANVVIDVADSPSFSNEAAVEFFETATSNLMTAGADAGIRHHVALSMVGIDRNPRIAYFHAKLAQERLIKASGIPYTVVRSTQFFESLGTIAKWGALGKDVHVSPALVQPIAADDAVVLLAGIALEGPLHDTIEIAGPQRLPLDELVQRYLLSQCDRRRVIGNIHARYFGLELDDKSLTPGDRPRLGATRFEDWLSRSSASKV